jgi:predicted deacylase
MEAEVGGAGLLDLTSARRYAGYLENAILFLAGRRHGSEHRTVSSPRFFTTQSAIRAETSGIWFRHLDEGVMIEKDTLIGEIVRVPDGGTQQIRVPAAGLLGAIRKRPAITDGDELAWLFGGLRCG